MYTDNNACGLCLGNEGINRTVDDIIYSSVSTYLFNIEDVDLSKVRSEYAAKM